MAWGMGLVDEVEFDVGVDEGDGGDDDGSPEGDFEDSDAVGDFLIAPFGESAVDFVEFAVDAGFDFVEFLVEVGIGGLFDASGDAAEEACLFDFFFDGGGSWGWGDGGEWGVGGLLWGEGLVVGVGVGVIFAEEVGDDGAEEGALFTADFGEEAFEFFEFFDESVEVVGFADVCAAEFSEDEESLLGEAVEAHGFDADDFEGELFAGGVEREWSPAPSDDIEHGIAVEGGDEKSALVDGSEEVLSGAVSRDFEAEFFGECFELFFWQVLELGRGLGRWSGELSGFRDV